MRKYLLASIAIATAMTTAMAAPAHAESWYNVGEGDEDIFYADADSLSHVGNMVTLTAFDGMSDAITGYSKEVYFWKSTMQFDCGANRYRHQDRAGYDENYAYVGAIDYDPDWHTVTEGTFGESLYQFACEGGWRDVPVDNPFDDADEYWFYSY